MNKQKTTIQYLKERIEKWEEMQISNEFIAVAIKDLINSELLERNKNEIVQAVNKSGGYVDIVKWEENHIYTKGEQYFDENFV